MEHETPSVTAAEVVGTEEKKPQPEIPPPSTPPPIPPLSEAVPFIPEQKQPSPPPQQQTSAPPSPTPQTTDTQQQQQQQRTLIELRVACAKLEGLRTNLDHQVKELETKLKETRTRCDELEATVTELQGTLDLRTTQAKAAQQQLDLATNARDDLQQALRDREQSAEELEKGLRGELAAAEAKLQEKDSELERLREHLIEQEEADTQQILEAEMRNNELTQQLKQQSEFAAAVPVLQSRCEEWQQYSKGRDQEVQRLTVALANLQGVLEQFQADQEQMIANETRPVKAELEVLRADVKAKAAVAAKVPDLERAQAALQQANIQLQKDLAERETALFNLRGQIEPLQEALTKTAAQLDGLSYSQETLIDKRVVKKMFLTFFARPQQRSDILELMASILQFNEAEKSVVGLASPIVPPSPSGKFKDASTKSLTELWVEFLLHEAGADPSAKTSVLRKT